MAGDITAGHQVIQIIRTRCRLLGLDLQTTKPSATLARSPGTVVVTEEEPEGRPDNCNNVWQR